MHRTAPLTVLLVALASTAVAQTPTVTYYMHKSASPVGVPGGTTTFILDENPPVAPTPVAASVSVPKGVTASFPLFIAPTFAASATLGLDFDVTVHLSANLSMNNCAFVQAVVQRIDSGGSRIGLAQGTLQTSVPQGSFGGTVGFGVQTISVSTGCDRPSEDVTIQAGESIAVSVNVMNGCKANRTISLAYDSATAPTNVVLAPTPPPSDVFTRACWAKCQQATARATARFWYAKTKCAMRCQANHRKGLNPYSDCFAPYAGATLACITDPLSGAEAKASLAIRKACTTPVGRCPLCYTAADCTAHATDWVGNIEGQVDSFGPGLYCDPTTDAAKGKCMDYTARAVARYYGYRQKCYDKCFTNEAKGLVPPNACNPLAGDPATQACLSSAQVKTIGAAEKVCSNLGVVPDCGGFPYPTGADWTNLMSIAIDGNVPSLYCGGD